MEEETKEHGTRKCYQSGCRLPECVQANRDYATAKRREQGIPAARRGVTCGVSGYIAGGHRCDVCRSAYAAYRQQEREKKRQEKRAS